MIKKLSWKDLTINQRISLKGFFYTEPELAPFKAIMIIFDYRMAIDIFLNS